MTSIWLDRALEKLWPPVQLWVHYPDSEGKRAKAELLDAYDSLGPREKAAYDADVREAFLRAHGSDRVIAYRRRKARSEPMAGLSLSTLEPGARSDTYSVSLNDVLVHWAQSEMPLSSRAYGHEKEIILRRDAEPVPVGEVKENPTLLPGSKIVEILSVIDTREYEEVADGVFKPIAGSGNENECARCGRMHEVHAHVRLESGETAVVGTGCMRGESVETTKAVTKAANAAKRLAALKAEYKKLTEELAAWDAAWEEVLSLTPPEPVRAMHRWQKGEEVIRIGDAVLFVRHIRGPEPTRGEMDGLIHDWRLKRMEATGLRHPAQVASYLKEVEKRIRKLIPPPQL